MKKETNIKIKTPEEISLLREAGRKLAAISAELRRSLKSGMTTLEADQMAENVMTMLDPTILRQPIEEEKEDNTRNRYPHYHDW